MTRDEIRRAATNLLAMAEGKKLLLAGVEYSWEDMKSYGDIGYLANATIKPEPRYRPWTEAEALIATSLRTPIIFTDPNTGLKTSGLLGIEDGVWVIGGRQIHEGLEFLCRNSTVAKTGEPCGVLEGA